MLPALHTCLLYTHINARKIENCITKRCIQLLRLKDKIIMQVITKIKIKKNFVNLHGRNKCDIDNDSIRENMFNEKRIYKTNPSILRIIHIRWVGILGDMFKIFISYRYTYVPRSLSK